MNFLKRFWRWLMAEKNEANYLQVKNHWREDEAGVPFIAFTTVYDPSTDEMRTLKGENESYFE